MNCSSLLQDIGFTCSPRDGGAARVTAPLFLGGDGQHVGCYVESLASGWRVSDYGETLMHAAQMGADISPKRIHSMQRRLHRVVMDDDGVLSIQVPAAGIVVGVSELISASVRVSDQALAWRPSAEPDTFTRQVDRELSRVAGQRLLRNVSIQGASGHQMEFPFGIEMDYGTAIVQPVSAVHHAGRMDWGGVYRAYGKMSDLRELGGDRRTRIAVIDDDLLDKEDVGSAITMLAHSCEVLRFSTRHQWLDRFKEAA